MSFVVDGAQWRFDGWSAEEIDSALSALVDRMQVARSRKERVWLGDELQTSPVLGNLDIWQLWSPDSPVRLPVELQQELSATLALAQRYLDEEPWPQGMEHVRISIGNEPAADNTDVAWAHHHVRAGRAIACLGLQRTGAHHTRSDAGAADVHWVTDERGHRAFFRAAIDVERDTAETLIRLAPHAYPDLHFLHGVWRGLGDFEGGYARVRLDLRQHFAVYDDHGKWAFTSSPPAETEDDPRPSQGGAPGQRLVERRFALRGVEVAPEKPNVAQDKTCREARERTLKGRTLYCEWHGKIEKYINRIHLHPPIPESDGKVVVAIFHAHLPLP